jgi:hypothetical protein
MSRLRRALCARPLAAPSSGLGGPAIGAELLRLLSATISRLGRMFMARPHRRALAFLGFWVQQARRIGTA